MRGFGFRLERVVHRSKVRTVRSLGPALAPDRGQGGFVPIFDSSIFMCLPEGIERH